MRSQAGTEGLPSIPAMTSDAEREAYYRLVKENAHKGAVVELGPWLGASTAYIAAGMRDAGVSHKAQVYDRFKLNKEHLRKAKGLSIGPCLDEFKTNLGPLLDYVEPHPGEIAQLEWDDEPIAVLIADAPKRVPAISSVLTKFRKALRPGSIMAWQDFCHFPSYEIPACLYRIRDHIEFVEAVVPGTTMVLRVKSQWGAREAALAAFDPGAWTPEEIREAWIYWNDFVPAEKFWLFQCGAAMFACDIGQADWAVALMGNIISDGGQESIGKKWRYLREVRPDFVIRYAPLFEYLEQQGVFEAETC